MAREGQGYPCYQRDMMMMMMLNVAICSVCLHFSNFCHLSSVADFSNTEARFPISAGSHSYR